MQLGRTTHYPLLGALLAACGLPLRGCYTTKDVAEIFEVSKRTIEKLQAEGTLRRRKLPGYGKCLSCDLEELLQGSESSRGSDGGPDSSGR